MNGARDFLRAQLGRFVLVPSACALGEGAPSGAYAIHDLPSTIRADRSFGRKVAELGMPGGWLEHPGVRGMAGGWREEMRRMRPEVGGRRSGRGRDLRMTIVDFGFLIGRGRRAAPAVRKSTIGVHQSSIDPFLGPRNTIRSGIFADGVFQFG